MGVWWVWGVCVLRVIACVNVGCSVCVCVCVCVCGVCGVCVWVVLCE